MSNIYSIEELRKEFLEKTKNKDIKEYAHKQQELVESLVRKVNDLTDKLKHSEEIIKNMGSSLVIKDNTEELICIEQINILKERSKQRELDINDVKKLDILIKNLRLIRSEPTDNINTNYRDVKEADLVAIAAGKSTEESN